MTAANTCPQCATPLPADAPLGLCPACLVRRGLEDTAATLRETAAEPGGGTAGRPPDPLSIDQLAPFFPQLELLELLGRGGMGVVYKARQKHLDRLVALKILPTDLFITPAFTERFAREAKALARLSHPRIVTIHDFGRAYPAGADPNSPTTPALYYLLMEYVDGSNLRQLIKSLSPEQALAIVPQICEALQFAHDEGVVHRDIKPENILVDKKGRVKIADFGLAKLLQHATGPADYTLTHPDKILGTLHYMAPEQLERPTEVDHRADIYSLGVVFYELLTGHLPLGRFALPSETRSVDARLDEVVLKALEREPEKRYQHASEVGTSVEAVRQTPAPQPVMPAAVAPIPPAPPEAALQEKENASAKSATPPQLSRNAIAGAICGVVALLAGIMAGVANSNIKLLYYFDSQAGLYHEGPNWAIALWCIGLVLAGIAAVVMPLLGAIGVAQIRRAPEKLYGLRLALFDALLVPLLILDGLVVGVFGAIFFWNSNGAKAAPDSPLVQHESLSVAPLLVGLGIWLPIIDVLIYWLVWRKLRIKKAPASVSKKDTGPTKPATSPVSTGANSSVSIAREPKRFYIYAFGLYGVCWVLPLLLWNLGWVGFILSVGIFATIAWRQARYLQKFRPKIVAARAAEPRWVKALRPSQINLSFTLAFVLLLLAFALQQDSRTDPDIANIFGGGFQTLSETSQGFLKGFQADDPKRLSADVRDLSLRDAMATFPNGLTYNSTNKEQGLQASLFRPIHTSSFMKELGITFSILLYPSAVPPEFRQFSFYSLFIPMGLYFFLAGFADMLSAKGYKFSGLAWKPALALTALLVASFLVVSFVSAMVFSAVRSSRTQAGEFASFHAINPIVSNSGQAAENLFPALDRWALNNGYEIAAITNGKLSDTHRLPEVPANVTYRAAVLWKPGLFDRLGMNWEGIYMRAPKILVQAANTDHYSEISFDYPLFSGNYASSVASNAILKDLDDSLKGALATTNPTTASGIVMHGTKSVAPTPDELTHILAELPKPFTQDLSGSAEQKIKELGTKVWALDFDQGPASFWIAAHEEGQKTFPERLPETGPGVVWRVEKPQAHILMWLQPREEVVQMSPQALGSMRKQAGDLPDYALGIDVDGQAILRYVFNTLLSKPQIPLWFGWMNRELQESSGAIDLDTKTGTLHSRNQAMVFIRAAKTPDGTPAGKKAPPAATVEFGLWYLPDNAPSLPTATPATVLPPSDENVSRLSGFWRSVQPVAMPGKEPALQTLWFAPDGTAKVGIVQHTKNGQFVGNNIAFTRPDGTPDETVAFWLFADHLVFIPANSDPRQPVVPLIYFNRLPVSAKQTAINGYWRGLPARTGVPARLGDGAVTLYFDSQAVATESLDVDLPALAMKYSVQRGAEASRLNLHYMIGNGPALRAEASTNSAATELTLTHFSPNGGESTAYERDTLGIDAAPEYSATPLKPGERPKSDRQRFFDIGRTIIGVYTSPGSTAEGEQMAREALRLAEKLPDEPLTPDALDQAHTVLGLAALKKGDLVAAKSHLLQSISDRPSSSLDSSGPQLMLAGALLARGERQTVLEFLDQCARDYPGIRETMQRRREIIIAGHTPDDLVYKDPSAPLFGHWISVKPILYTLAIVTFNPDGTATYAQGYRLHGSYQITDGKLRVTDEQTKTISDLGPFTITQDKLTFANMNNDANKYSAHTDGKPVVFERVGKGTDLVGTWVGKSRLLDAGPSEFTMTYGADGSATLAEEITMANFQYRYYLDGKKLYYSLTSEGKTTDSTGTAVFDKDQLILDEFPVRGIGEASFKRDNPTGATTMPQFPQSR